MSDIDRLSREISKMLRENKTNTTRIKKLTPHIERKLDIVSNPYTYKMDFPATYANSVFLNLYVKPDNCCECLKGSLPLGGREINATIGNYEGVPAPSQFTPSDGLDHKGLVTSAQTLGTQDSPWFAYEGYPFFHLTSAADEYFENNRFDDFYVSSQTIYTPTTGSYFIKFVPEFWGTSTVTSKITISVKTRPNSSAEWTTLSSRIYSIENGRFFGQAYDTVGDFHSEEVLYVMCVGIVGGAEIAGFIKADDIYNWYPYGATLKVTLVGMGYGLLTGTVKDSVTKELLPDIDVLLGDFEGTRVAYTDEFGRYVFDLISPGYYCPTAAYDSTNNYYSSKRCVTVGIGAITQLDFEVTPK